MTSTCDTPRPHWRQPALSIAIACATALPSCSPSNAQEPTISIPLESSTGVEVRALDYRGDRYLSFRDLASIESAKIGYTEWARGTLAKFKGGSWELGNGGDRIIINGSETTMLERLALILDAEEWIPQDSAAAAFGLDLKDNTVSTPEGETRQLRARNLETPRRRFLVGEIEPAEFSVRLDRTITADKSRVTGVEASVELQAGTRLRVRRSVEINGAKYWLANAVEAPFDSFLIEFESIPKPEESNPIEATAGQSDWAGILSELRKQASTGYGLLSSDSLDLRQQVALTIDMCWSLRPAEAGLFGDVLPRLRAEHRLLRPVMFMSGRWVEQHPGGMQDLLDLDSELSDEEGAGLTWALHSFAHPKSGGFMNDYSIDGLVDDTLQVERSLLEWGIVPSVYYRFPGLIHDQERLEAIIDLGLAPIDCDGWLATFGEKPVYGRGIDDGSVILIHGNGNEHQGIILFEEWLSEHQDWSIAPLHRFLPAQVDPSTND